jgi:CIC family chloride channel protein
MTAEREGPGPLLTRRRLASIGRNLGLALAIGALAGLGAVAFRYLLDDIHSFFFDGGARLSGALGRYYIVLLPVVGGLLVGPVIHFFAREARGNGVPEVMKTVALEGGRIRPIVSVVKVAASSLCIGSGGSAGREGPIAQIGASLGSSISQWLHLSEDDTKLLVACGAAGGIAATFNAPIAGALFTLEIILRRVITPIFAYIFLSAVTAAYFASFFIENFHLFTMPSFQFVSPVEIVLYAALGVAAALAAAALIRGIYGCEDIFNAIKMPEYLKPALGGLAVGLIGLYDINLLGLGYGEVQLVLTGSYSAWFLAAMCLLKILATSATLGSGGSGGVFSPGLFVGAMLGTALAGAFRAALPIDIGPAGAYGLVAMAAVFSAATRAPFTSVIIILEMTGEYSLVLPLMAAVSVSTALSAILTRGTIYTTKLLRAGIEL